jgi:plasmid stabilization system protein ParE
VSAPLHVEVSALASGQIREAEAWWRVNRTKAPNAIREEFERAAGLVAAQPHIGTRARNLTLPGVRRLHLARIRYDIYYRVTHPSEQLEILAFWQSSRGSQPHI